MDNKIVDFTVDLTTIEPIVINIAINVIANLLWVSRENDFLINSTEYWNKESIKDSPIITSNDFTFVRFFYKDMLLQNEYNSFSADKLLPYIKDNNGVSCDLYKDKNNVKTLMYRINALSYLFTTLHLYEDTLLEFVDTFKNDNCLKKEAFNYAINKGRYILAWVLNRLPETKDKNNE